MVSPILAVINNVRSSPLARRVNAANTIYQFLDTFNRNTFLLEDTHPLYNPRKFVTVSFFCLFHFYFFYSYYAFYVFEVLQLLASILIHELN